MLDTAADLTTGASFSDTFVWGTGATGTVEPAAWLPGKLLVDIDDGAGPYDGTWASRPAKADLRGRGLMAPPFPDTQIPPGAKGPGPIDFILWFSGELQLDAGVQHVALAVATNALAFVDVIARNGTPLVHCTDAMADCPFTTTAAGWYELRIGWKRPSTATGNVFELKWAPGTGALDDVPASRLRARAATAELAGTRIEGFAGQRIVDPVVNGTALQDTAPFALAWAPSLLGLTKNALRSPAYRAIGQLRILDAGSYDVLLTPASEAAFRLWIDGVWVSPAARWNVATSTNPPETVTRTLTAGWHDVVLEGYEEGGDSNSVVLTLGKTGAARTAPTAANLRPLLGATDAMVEGANAGNVPLPRNGTATQTIIVPAVAGAPKATSVDVLLTLKPKQWTGVTISLKPPGAGTGIPLTFPNFVPVDDTLTTMHASLTATELGTVDAAGTWTVEITHPDVAVNASNVLSEVRVSVHYLGSPTLGTPTKIIAESSTYSRMVALDKAHELRGLIERSTAPTGSTVAVTAQVCSDAAGTSCQTAQTATQLASAKPMAQFVKLTATFTSDGFAVPWLDMLTLRYLD